MDLKKFRLKTRLELKANVVEEVYSTIAKIDAVKNSFTLTDKFLPQAIERLTSSVIVTSTGASNRIEGNKLSDTEVEKLYKNLRIKKFKTRDEQEVAGYLECLEAVFENYDDIKITESWILGLNDQMLQCSEKDSHHKGQYKFGSNRV